MENPSLAITDCNHLASPMMPIDDPRDRIFYPTCTLMINFYILYVQPQRNRLYSIIAGSLLYIERTLGECLLIPK